MIAQLALLTALTIGGQDSKWFDLPLSVNGEVSAKVVEVHADGNHKPLPSVNIQFRSITGDAVVARTKTDAEGRFKLAGVAPAVYTLEAGQSTRVTVRVVAENEDAANEEGNTPVKNASAEEAVKGKDAKAETVIGVPPVVPAAPTGTAVPAPQDLVDGGVAPVGSSPVVGSVNEYGMTNCGGCGMGGCGGCGGCGCGGDPYAAGYGAGGYGGGGYGGGFGGAGGGFGGGGGGVFGGGGAGLAALAALPLAALAFDNSDGGGRSTQDAPSNFNP